MTLPAMKFILIIMVFGYQNSLNLSVTFDDQPACEAARDIITYSLNQANAGKVLLTCVPSRGYTKEELRQ